jgi:predicted RNA-binding Zn ribbon-like protein
MSSSEFALVGGDPSLDLVNTLVHHFDPGGPYDLLESPLMVLDWYEAVELIDPAARVSLHSRAKTMLSSARDVRTHLDTLYRSVIANKFGRPLDEAIAGLNAFLARGCERVTLRRERIEFHREIHLDIAGFGDPVIRVVHCAAKRLAHLEPNRLRECANPDCDLIFYDETRNGQRRWCDMATCGNRLKQARHRTRLA